MEIRKVFGPARPYALLFNQIAKLVVSLGIDDYHRLARFSVNGLNGEQT